MGVRIWVFFFMGVGLGWQSFKDLVSSNNSFGSSSGDLHTILSQEPNLPGPVCIISICTSNTLPRGRLFFQIIPLPRGQGDYQRCLHQNVCMFVPVLSTLFVIFSFFPPFRRDLLSACWLRIRKVGWIPLANKAESYQLCPDCVAPFHRKGEKKLSR